MSTRSLSARLVTAFAVTAFAAAGGLLSACGAAATGPGVPDRVCGVIVDGTVSTDGLTRQARPIVERFVLEHHCATVQPVVISANSVAEVCELPPVRLDDLEASPDNPTAIHAEITERKVPAVLKTLPRLVACVAEYGTNNATDVFGAFTRLAALGPNLTEVLVLSDMVNTVGVQLGEAALGDADKRSALTDQVVRSGLVPPMHGWTVEVGGAAYGTTHLSPAASHNLQVFWQELVTKRGGSWRQVAL